MGYTFYMDTEVVVQYLKQRFPVGTKVVIGASSTFHKEVEALINALRKAGFEVLATVSSPLANPVQEYPKVHKEFFEALNKAQVYLVVNLEKHGVPGYIGAGVFLEIGYVVTNNVLGKSNIKVVLVNPPRSKCAQDELDLWYKLGWYEVINKGG